MKFSSRSRAVIAGASVLYAALCADHANAVGQIDIERLAKSTLRLIVELSSDTATLPEDLRDRDRTLDIVYRELISSEADRTRGEDPAADASDPDFALLVATQGTRPADYLWAMRRSYARSRGADDAGDRDWSSKHSTAARQYAVLAASALVADAERVEAQAAALRQRTFAVRRSPERATEFLDGLRQNGLSAAQRELILETGYVAEDELEVYLEDILATPPEELGRSIVELLTDAAKTRRDLAASLNSISAGSVVSSDHRSQSFNVFNPHDSLADVELYIRRASIPPLWKLSLVSAEGSSGQNASAALQEVEAGVHYRVTLPAKGQLAVASVVHPVGTVGEGTTARWAVEGRIGAELLGGMVHELFVPKTIANLQLPPVGSLDMPGAQPSRWVLSTRMTAPIAGALVIAILLLTLLHRKRRGHQSNEL